MKVVHIATEMDPFAKVGGLGDVLQSLPQALSRKGIDTTVIMPKYKSIPNNHSSDLELISKNLLCYENGKFHENNIWYTKVNDVKVFFIEPVLLNYFLRENIYGYCDDQSRFIYFSRAALEFLSQEKKVIDVLHLHDWHTSLVAPLYKDVFQQKGLSIKKIILTIHSLKYQGKCRIKHLDKIGLDGKAYLNPLKLQDNNPNKPEVINLLKGGIIYSDYITTVSPSYAYEILFKEKGCGLDSTLRESEDKLIGILNGIDTTIWSPKNDKFLATKYSNNDSIEEIIRAKEENKTKLRKKLGLEIGEAPIIANIGRLVPQKGPKLLRHAIKRSIEKKGQFILLGSAPVKKIANNFLELKTSLKDNNNVYLDFEYNEDLSHLIFAASDFIIVPSLFEPCGLTQIIAFSYGTIPIVRETGGLRDTVHDIDFSEMDIEKRNGYTFEKFSFKGVDSALIRAIDCWFTHPEKIKKLVSRIMKIDHSWDQSVLKYISIYQEEAKKSESS
jgi:starch synthase